MGRVPYYQLLIERRPVSVKDEPGDLVWVSGERLLNKEIPQALMRLVHSGDRFGYRIQLYYRKMVDPIAYIADNGISHQFDIDSIPNSSIRDAFELTACRLDADRLYGYRDEMRRLFDTNRELFVVKSVGSDRGYVRVNTEEITVRKLDRETVIKQATRWTCRYKHVTTWAARSVPELLYACGTLRMEAAKHGA